MLHRVDQEGRNNLDGLAGRFSNDALEAHRIARTLSGALRVKRALIQNTEEGYANALTVLYRYQSEGGVTVCFTSDPGGVVRISSDQHRPDSMIGSSIAAEPFFQQAMNGNLGLQILDPGWEGVPAYAAAFPVYDDTGRLIGSAGAMLSLKELERVMRNYTHSYLVREDGQILLEYENGKPSAYLWTRHRGTPPLLDSEPIDGHPVEVAGQTRLVLRKPLPVPEASLVVLQSLRPVVEVRLAGLAITTLAALLALLSIGIFIQKEQNLQRIRLSESKYRQLVEDAGSIILQLDTEGRILFANGFALSFFDYAAGDFLGAVVADTICTGDHPEFYEILRRISSHPDAQETLETVSRTRTGKKVHVSWSLRPVPPPKRKPDTPARILCVGNDITRLREAEAERHKLQEQILHVQKLESMGVLAGGIAHDFNNLLQGILGNASLAMQELPPESSVRDSIVHIESAALRAAELTGQMLAYSGKGRFTLADLDLNEPVRDMARLLKSSISKRVELQLDLREKLPGIRGDSAQIQQVIMNLITNGSEAIETGNGTVTLRTDFKFCDARLFQDAILAAPFPAGDYVVLEVTDDGCGMDRETVQKIFDPFFTTKFTGRGLGLAAVLGIVRGHKGAIFVDTQPGRGTRFTLMFPASSTSASVKSLPEQPPAWTGSGTALLAEDDPDVLELTARMLRKLNFTVIPAHDGVEAVEAYHAHREIVDLVVLDMTMPRMGGEEACRTLRTINPHLPILLYSGFSKEDAMNHFQDFGPSAFLEKPFRPPDLASKIRDICSSQEADNM